MLIWCHICGVAQRGAELEVNLSAKVSKECREWYDKIEQGVLLSPPTSILTEAYKLTFRTVKFDTLPRFKLSPYGEELVSIHLRYVLHRPAFQDALKSELAPPQKASLLFCIDAAQYSAKNVTLASGWPADETVQAWACAHRSSHSTCRAAATVIA